MPPRTRAEAERAFEELSRLEFDFRRDDSGLDKAAKYLKWLWGFGAIIAICASTSGVALFQIEQLKSEVSEIKIQAERFRNMDDDHARRIQANEVRIDSNREERRSQITAMQIQIEELNTRKKEHDIMWTMKLLGRTNKDEYSRTPAPDIPEK